MAAEKHIEQRIAVVGDHGVGRTSLISRYTGMPGSNQKTFYSSDGSGNVYRVTQTFVEVSPDNFEFNVHPRYNGIILTYDTTSISSFSEIRNCIVISDQSIPIILVGTKQDLPNRAISSSRAQELASKFIRNIKAYECSTTTGEGVDRIFSSLNHKMMAPHKKELVHPVHLLPESEQKARREALESEVRKLEGEGQSLPINVSSSSRATVTEPRAKKSGFFSLLKKPKASSLEEKKPEAPSIEELQEQVTKATDELAQRRISSAIQASSLHPRDLNPVAVRQLVQQLDDFTDTHPYLSARIKTRIRLTQGEMLVKLDEPQRAEAYFKAASECVSLISQHYLQPDSEVISLREQIKAHLPKAPSSSRAESQPQGISSSTSSSSVSSSSSSRSALPTGRIPTSFSALEELSAEDNARTGSQLTNAPRIPLRTSASPAMSVHRPRAATVAPAPSVSTTVQPQGREPIKATREEALQYAKQHWNGNFPGSFNDYIADLRGRNPGTVRADLSGVNFYERDDLRRANLAGADLSGADLAGANLSDAYFRGAALRDANLTGANLARTRLYDANLTGAILSWADLSDANLRDANLTRAELRDANLTRADLSDAELTGTKLDGAKNFNISQLSSLQRYQLTSPTPAAIPQPAPASRRETPVVSSSLPSSRAAAPSVPATTPPQGREPIKATRAEALQYAKQHWIGNFSGSFNDYIADLRGRNPGTVRADLSGVRFQINDDLSGTDLSGAILSGTDLSGTDLSGTDLSGAILSGAILSGAILSGAILSGAILSGVDLRARDLSGANLMDTNLSGVDLSAADLSGVNLSGKDLGGANLSGADLRAADLRWANLRAADLSGADLSVAILRDTNLTRAELRDANLTRADLSGASLTEANLTGTDLDRAINIPPLSEEQRQQLAAPAPAASLQPAPATRREETPAVSSSLPSLPSAAPAAPPVFSHLAPEGNAGELERATHVELVEYALKHDTYLDRLRQDEWYHPPRELLPATGSFNDYIASLRHKPEGTVVADLSGANLTGIVLSNANLHRVNFRGAILRNANFSGTSLVETDFYGADLAGATFEGAHFHQTKLAGAINTPRLSAEQQSKIAPAASEAREDASPPPLPPRPTPANRAGISGSSTNPFAGQSAPQVVAPAPSSCSASYSAPVAPPANALANSQWVVGVSNEDVTRYEADMGAFLGKHGEEFEKFLPKEVYNRICCPITDDIIRYPVTAADGTTYERQAIQQWLEMNNTSPNGQDIPVKLLFPNVGMRQEISNWRDTFLRSRPQEQTTSHTGREDARRNNNPPAPQQGNFVERLARTDISQSISRP